MKKIIGIVNPFELKQDLYVYEDNVKIDAVQPNLDQLSKAIFALVEQYDIQEIAIKGPKTYVNGLLKNSTDYTNKELKITIL